VHQKKASSVESLGPAGGTLTVIDAKQSEVPRKKTSRTALLPLLIALFLVSYAILTMLVIEQGRTIESQRSLLREMLKDSTQLAALKNKLANAEAKQSQDKAAAKPEQKESDAGNSAAAPKTTDKDAKRPGKSTRSLKQIPQKPAADLEDVRRSTRVI
jgi:hypothetical protein